MPLGGARGGEAPPRRRGYGGVLSPVGDTKGGLSPFEEIKREKLPISVLPYGGGGKSSKSAPLCWGRFCSFIYRVYFLM